MKLSNGIKKELNFTNTENGAVAYKSSLNTLIDFYSQVGAMREISPQHKQRLFSKSFADAKLETMKVLFHALDIRGGLGETNTFIEIYDYIIKTNEEIAIKNLSAIPFFGRWDIIIKLAYANQNTKFEEAVLSIISKTLNEDLDILLGRGMENEPISLLAKWMPSENTSSKETRAMAHWLIGKFGAKPSSYRKTLSALRARIGIVETKLSQGGEINYSTVPSRAMLKYRNAFYRKDEIGFKDYLSKVENGETKINSSVLYPYDLVNKIMYQDGHGDKVIEAQWSALPNYMEKGNNYNCLPVVDVSGSMSGIPIAAAVGIGIYVSERLNGEFKNKFITFSENPELVSIKGNTLSEKVGNMESEDWGYNTDVEAVFDLVLNVAVKNNLLQSELPDDILILSDMEFDEAIELDDKVIEKETLFSTIKNKWNSKGYKMPRVVFWNLAAKATQYPMTAEDNCLLVSGYSPVIMKAIMNKKVVTPIDIVIETISNPRYDIITI